MSGASFDPPSRMSGPTPRPRSLTRRLVVAMAIVAVVAVAVTLVVGFQLLRSAQRDATREALASQADALASASDAVRGSVVDGLSGLGDASLLVAAVAPDGTVTGRGSSEVPRRVVASLKRGQSASTSVVRDHTTYLVEARPVAGGGGIVIAQDAEHGGLLTGQLALRLLIALAIGLAVAVVAAVIAARAVTRPLRRLRDHASGLAAGSRMPVPAASDIAEVVEVEHALSALAAALAQSEARQREFLLSISHELRTPLTAIRGWAEALADGVVPNDEAAGAGATLVAETDRLAAFTDDLLALARLEADDFPVDAAPCDVALVLREAARGWQGAAADAGVEVTADVPDAVAVIGDARRIRQVVDGLVENALRVSGTGTAVVLRAGALGAGARAGTDDGATRGAWIEVADTGPGITAEDAAVAFDRGRLRDRYREVRAVGTGLGLSIAARLVGRLGGTIAARPGDPSGAVFRIELPAAPRSAG